MKMIKTVESAKKAIKELEEFVFLVENYEVTTLEQRILKEYAYTGSIPKVVANINGELRMEMIDHTAVSNLLQSKSQDLLHRILKDNYLLKTRPSRRK
ncbi:hypothetical protein MHH33_01575 [Paenisporosarcina sp. FSL H8-0542]|uniref:hypothetical protein n=1 Tax=Paenisporosarcina sp. FSL H8-0542 TaxID=2921401 RepID=UPI00315A830B